MSTATVNQPTTSPAAAALLNELQAEAPITRRLLERIPAEKLEWQPHPKSMSVGQLGVHMGRALLNLPGMITPDSRDVPGPAMPAPPANLAEVLDAFDRGMETTTQFLSGLTPEAAEGIFTLRANGKVAINMPRVRVARMLLLNHIVHHRGQLSVYLRLLEVPVPVIYGRSADENPFE